MQRRFQKPPVLAGLFRWFWMISIVLFPAGLLSIAECVHARGGHPPSAEEKDWLGAHPVVTLAPDPAYPPIEYFDENGVYCGIAADYVALLEKKLDFRFKITRLQSWDEILEKAKSRQIDMFGAAAETPQRSEYMLFTRPFVEFPSVIIVRKNVSDSISIEKLKGMKVAIVSGYADHDYIKNNYPQLQLDEVPTVSTGLRKVSFGMVDALIANLAAATYFIEKEGITNLRLAGNTGYTYRLGFGVRKDWPELIKILENGLALIEPHEKEAIFKKWVNLEQESLFASRVFWIIILSGMGISFVVVIGLFVWNRSLKSIVSQRTLELSNELAERRQMEEELRKSRDRLELRVRERTAELEKANRELRQVPSKLIGFQEEERKRLASELHDSIGQTLAALKFWVEMALKLRDEGEAGAALNHLEQFVPILQRSIEETRNIYMGLRPSMLDSMGLLATLEWLRHECMRLYPDRHVELQTGVTEEEIPENLKVNMFRIVQEALNNVAKHSKAEWVEISLSINGNCIELVISDDGLGMDLESILQTDSPKTLGFISMRERA